MTRALLVKGFKSIALMAISCAACAAAFSFEIVPAGLLIALILSPATVLFLFVERYGGAKQGFKHAIYIAYCALWMSVFLYAYLTAVEGREIALIAMSFTAIAAPCGYMPLVGMRRFSLRALFIATTLVAVLLGLVVWAVR